MKTFLFSIFITSITLINAQSQVTSRASFQIGFQNTIANNFFVQHSNVDHVVFTYMNSKAVALNIVLKDGTQEQLDLAFESDQYICSRKYKDLVFPQSPSLTIQALNAIKNWTDSTSHYNVKSIMLRDSVIYRFSVTSANAYPIVKKHSGADKITTKRNQLKTDILVYDTISLHKYARFKGNPHQVQKN